MNVLQRGALIIALGTLRVLRIFLLESDARLYSLLAVGPLQPLLQNIGRWKAYQVYCQAVRSCPAYQDFHQRFVGKKLLPLHEFSNIPETVKDNYVRTYSIEERCYGEKIPTTGVVIDESSGSSGLPNNWVRGPGERHSVKTVLQMTLELTFRKTNVFFLNCFALGPWATGMNISMSLVDIAILKSIGPDKQKLENTLALFGPHYTYVISGYPPFIKNWLDTTTLDLAPYTMHLVTGGEGLSEGLRSYFQQVFKRVYSSYGASDLEINIAAETDWSIALRQVCLQNSTFCQELFGRSDAPMIFQYNPLDYYIESNDAGELIFTLTRLANVAPKIRYNIKDQGGSRTYKDVKTLCKTHDVSFENIPGPIAHFPILFIYGRSDLTVSFYGSNVYTSDIDAILSSQPNLLRQLYSFQLQTWDDEQFTKQLTLHLEQAESSTEALDKLALHDLFFQSLITRNQDFREASKMFSPEQVHIELWPYRQGPFALRDIRVKCNYIHRD